MRLIRTIIRYTGRWGIFGAPWSEEVRINLVEGNGHYFISTPWAMLDAVNGTATTDAQLEAVIRPCYQTEADALAHARAACPHFKRPDNLTVNGRLHDAIRWGGELVGAGQLADALGLSREELYLLARGEDKATRKQAAAALAYHGREV